MSGGLETDILTSMEEVDPGMVDEILDWKFTFRGILRINVNGL
jgi:hypothetical protein